MIIKNLTENVQKLNILLNSDKCNGYLHKDKHICQTSLRRILVRKINFSEWTCRNFKKGVLYLHIYLLKIVSFMK